MRRATLFTLGACILPLVLAACGGSPSDQIVEQVTQDAVNDTTKVDVQDGTTRMTTSEGTVTVGTQELPAEWPKDVPMYPGSTIQVAGTLIGQGNGALFLTSDAEADVMKFYQEALAKEGWKIDTTTDMSTIGILSASKEKRTATIQISASIGQTAIMIGLEEKPQE